MTQAELVDRARRYIGQALDVLAIVEGHVILPAGEEGALRSLRANLESAAADLTAAVKGA